MTTNTTNGQQALSPEDQRELDFLKKHIKYNNDWDGKNIWKCDLQDKLDSLMSAKNISNFLVPLKLDSNAKDILAQEPIIARLFTIILDVYDELPYRPDAAFDISWRALEKMMIYYSREVDNNKSSNVTELVKQMPVIISELLESNASLKSAFQLLLDNHSLASLKFCFNYLADDNRVKDSYDLLIDKDSNRISKRMQCAMNQNSVDSSLSTTLYSEFIKKYLTKDFYENAKKGDGSVVAVTSRKAAMCLISFMKATQDIDLNGVKFKPMVLSKRLELLMSGVLYSIRNNRFHGENYSLFKSSRANQTTYYSMYYCLIVTYILYWIVLYALLDKKGKMKFYTLDDIAGCINQCIERLKCLDNK